MYEYKLVTETLSITKTFSYLINSVIRNQVLPILTLDCFLSRLVIKLPTIARIVLKTCITIEMSTYMNLPHCQGGGGGVSLCVTLN